MDEDLIWLNFSEFKNLPSDVFLEQEKTFIMLAADIFRRFFLLPKTTYEGFTMFNVNAKPSSCCWGKSLLLLYPLSQFLI